MTSRISDNFKTQEMCKKAVKKDPCSLAEVPDHFETQEMCNKAVEKDLWSLMNVLDCFKKQDIYIKAAEKYPLVLITLRHKKCVTRQLG